MDPTGPGHLLSPDTVEVIDSLAVGFVALNRDWRITQVNAAAERILDRPASELIGHDLWERFPGARELEFGRVYDSVMQSGRPAAFDAYYPGLRLWFELRVQPTPEGIACYFLDVTARRTAEQNAVLSAARAEVIAGVAESMATTLSVTDNVRRLAELVVPYLGTWSIVSVFDDAGGLVDAGWWHVDPARRPDVERYAEVRLIAYPTSIAAESSRSGEPVVLATNAYETIRARMPAGLARDRLDALRPSMSAVLPMVARGRTIGLLTVYGDTPWTSDAFAVAREIASRAALSIDNSMAYEREEAARAQAERVSRRLALMATVSEALATTDDPDEAVGRLARLVVPELADWSLVTIIDEDGNLRVVGRAHRDPSREAEVAAYAERRSSAMSASSPMAEALRTTRPVVVADFDAEALARALPDDDVRADAMRLDPHGLAIIPLAARGRTFGELTLVTTHERGPHTPDEVETALEVARRAGPVLESARISQRAHRLSESMQRSVLAVSPPGPGVAVETRYRPAYIDHEVGGDWYDTYGLPDGATVVTIGDVMGHDVAAIAAMAQLRTYMRANAWTSGHSPAAVLTATDEASFGLGPGTFATALIAELRPSRDGSTALRWSNAGHLPPVLILPDGTVSLVRADTVDIPLGVLRGVARHDHTRALPAGSVLVLYTDGLVERRDRDIDDGLSELVRVLSGAPVDDLGALLDLVLAELDGPGPHHDDVALLALRVLGTDRPAAAGGAPSHAVDAARADLAVDLPGDATASAVARAHATRYLRGLPEDVADDAVLMVSELVSNAFRHGLAPITLHLTRSPTSMRVAVTDSGPGAPQVRTAPPDLDRPTGRGLLIVSTLASEWGVTTPASNVGKTVWFQIDVDPT